MIPTQQNDRMYIESLQIPLKEIPWETVKTKIIDPITGKPYKGMVLEGIFADLSTDNPNNNGRYYTEPEYLQMLNLLKIQIQSKKGVYGELEHPQGYNINSRNASHKLLDVWYDFATKKVWGRVILLNTPNGLIAQEIIKSGGQLGISARAAGTEIKNTDGTFTCKLKLLTTYDLVYHPGFSAAVLEFKELNESQKFIQDIAKQKTGFSGFIPTNNLGSIGDLYSKYVSLNENKKYCFYEWLFTNLNENNSDIVEMFEATQEKNEQDKRQQQKLEKNKSSDEDDIENELSSATDKDLKESKKDFFNQIKKSQNKLRQTKSVYDNSAGFIDGDYSL